MSARTPLAWLNLTHDKRRLLVAVAGITFAVLLMFMELGFWNAMLDSTVGVIRRFNADLVIVNRLRYSFHVNEPFTRRRLAQAASVPGVVAARPLYVEYAWSYWKTPGHTDSDQPVTRPIRVLAYDPLDPVLNVPENAPHAAALVLPDTVLFDRRSRDWYGTNTPGTRRELGGHTVEIIGNFELGTDFTADGNVIMSAANLARLFPQRAAGTNPLGEVDVGLVQVAQGEDPGVVKARLRQALPNDVAVFTRQELIDQEADFWRKSTPIGFIFLLGLIMGFVVGVIICYQILSSDIMDHLPEYATLKAIGYSNFYLSLFVLRQALWLAVLGFVPGVVLAGGLYHVLEKGTGLSWFMQRGTGLPMTLNTGRDLLVLALTGLMCLLSGLIAVRRVQTADPAEVFA